MVITERRIEAPASEGWNPIKFVDPDTGEAVPWKDYERVAYVRGLCDHGVKFGLVQEFHSDLTPDIDSVLMSRIARLDCTEHA